MSAIEDHEFFCIFKNVINLVENIFTIGNKHLQSYGMLLVKQKYLQIKVFYKNLKYLKTIFDL